MIKNKRGDATDYMILMVVLVFLAISFIVVIFVNTQLKLIITTTALNESAASESIVSAMDKVNAVTVQRGYVIVLGMFVIFIMLSALLSRQHPAFIFLNIILLIVTLFVSVFAANSYGALMDNPVLWEVMKTQTSINYVMEHLLLIVLGIASLDMIILFGKFFVGNPGGADGF